MNQIIKETLSKLDKPAPAADYSHKSADFLGRIKTHLMNSKDAYDSATQSIYEWCGLSKSLLATYIKLSNDGNASKQTAQNTMLVKVLENGMKQMERAQEKLDVCAANLNATSETLTALGTQMYNDYDENSEYFRRKMEHILRESSDAAAQISGPSGATGIASTVIEEKLIDELRERLNSIREFHQNSKVTADQAFIDIKQAKEKLNEKIQMISERKARIGETKSYTPTDNMAEFRKGLIESAERLITNCNEFRNKNAH